MLIIPDDPGKTKMMKLSAGMAEKIHRLANILLTAQVFYR